MIKMFRKCYCYCNPCRRPCNTRQNRIRTQCMQTRDIENIKEISYSELLEMLKEGSILIDVRTRQEFLEEHLKGAILIPYYDIYKKIVSVVPNKNETIIVYCKNGGRSSKACETLRTLGYTNVFNLKGGIEEI